MKTFLLLAITALSTLAFGCSHPTGHLVTAHHGESTGGEVDGQWFTRDIVDGGRFEGVELVYCPQIPGQPLVCRTAVVWRRGESELVRGGE